jgi:hypothetical protein
VFLKSLAVVKAAFSIATCHEKAEVISTQQRVGQEPVETIGASLEWISYDEFGKVYKYYEKSPLLEFLEAVPSQEASYVY